MGYSGDVGNLPTGAIVLGKYRIDGVLGRGGMGVVYAAHHTFMDQRVALKLLLPQALTGPDAVTRFITEARHAAKIPGENACRILDVGLLENGLPYIAMEFLEGKSLEALATERQTIDVSDAARWILEALVAVAHAHARGIVHRDLKPSNLFLATQDDGSTIIKVLDFGISKSADSAQYNITSTRGVLGSPAYVAPEHLRNAKSVDPRADIWSIGVVLYELVAGVPPFDGGSLGELFVAILERDPAPLASRRVGLPAEFCAVVHRCLAKNRDERFQNVAELAKALEVFAGPNGASLGDRVRKALASKVAQPASRSVADPSGTFPGVPPPVSSGSGPLPSTGGAALPAPPINATTGPPWSQSSARGGARRPIGSIVAIGALVLTLVTAAAVGFVVLHRKSSAVRASAAAPAPTETFSASPPIAESLATEEPTPPSAPADPIASVAPAHSGKPAAGTPGSHRSPAPPPTAHVGGGAKTSSPSSGLSTSRE